MGINGINDYSNIFNNYRVPSIPVVSVDEVAKQDNLKVQETDKVSTSAVSGSNGLEDISLPKVRQSNAALEDISLTFNRGDSFGYIGKDSDIYSLDVENALSDMQKDDVLRQYQVFVGNVGVSNAGIAQGNAIVNNEDGMVVPKFQ